jgi:dihydroxyacetone kinase-like protein
MKKFINDPNDFVYESLMGFAAAHARIVALNLDPLYLTRRQPRRDKVAVISGGGSGHEPLHAGFVGVGMLDAACPGQVFTSPTPNQILAAAKAVAGDSGVLLVVKNYSGDVMNFQMAIEMMDMDVAMVLVNDDVSVQSYGPPVGRRGIAGTLVVEKIVGAAAERGDDLQTCKRLGDRVNARTASMGIALSSCSVPEAGVCTFEIGEAEIEVGVGIHGEPGRRRSQLRPASELCDEMLEAILRDLSPKPGQEVLLHVNGLGATPLMELYLLYHAASEYLSGKGLKATRSLVGNYTTALETAGASITISLLDDELLDLWDAPVRSPSLCWQ